MEQLTLSWEEAPAKRSASPESARASWMSEVNSCSNMYELLGKLSPDGSFGKTCPEFCHRTKGEPLAPSSGRWQTSGILAHGECLTLNSSEWPSDAAVSFLSDVLEGGQERLQRYSLSPKACQGILRRASKRGKPLPPMLEAALRAQGGGVTAFAQNTRDEVRIQGDGTISGALAAQPGMKQQTYIAECMTPWDVQSKRIFPEGGCAQTLQSGTHEHNQHVAEPLVLASAHYNAEIGEGGVAPTLIAHIQKDAPVLAMGKTCSQPSAPQTGASSSSTTNPSTAGGSCSTQDGSGPDAICMADDNARAAVDEDLSGSLKVGGVHRSLRFV